MPSQPEITIIIPTFNRPQELSRALASIRNMRSRGIYTIVINDASTADYDEVVKQFADVIGKYIVLPSNAGVSHARNQGLRHAVTDWIVFLDDDDEFTGDYIDQVRKCIRERDLKENAFIWCNVESRLLGDRGVILNTKVIKPKLRKDMPEDVTYAALSIGASYGLTVNKTHLDGFDESFPVGEDIEFVMRMLKKGFIPHHLDEIGIVKYNYKFGSDLTSNYYKIYSDKCIMERILEKHDSYLMTFYLYYPYFIAWGVRCHYKNRKWLYGDRLLKKILTQHRFVNYVLYLTLKITKYIRI